ncbi:MAG: AI-2E family transporter [Oscillospiraceae bacterium]|nr:AI-2E family transporter [Oscillospiraceae bacterium]
MSEKQSLLRSPLFRMAAAGGVFFFLLLRADSLILWIHRLTHTLRPLLLGVLFAGMLNPAYEQLRTDFSAFAERHGHNPRSGWIRTASLIGALLPPLMILASIICILIPQISESVRLFSEHFDDYSRNLSFRLARFSETRLGKILPEGQPAELLHSLQQRLPALLRKTYGFTASLLGGLLDIGIGVVFALYLLADKQRLSGQMHRICRRIFPSARTAKLAGGLRTVCKTFARFLTSQCKESLILGALCWLGMTVFRFPYPVLISVIIGITNIVPYFGPLFGTVPCALLLLMVKPGAVIWFLLFIIVLQQIESNLIYPHTVGHSVGLPPAWVLAAIVIGGGLFGVWGMILSVPAAAAACSLLGEEQSAGNA